MTDSRMNFHDAAAPKIAPRILCIGMPVRDLTFRVPGLPARGSTMGDRRAGDSSRDARESAPRSPQCRR